MMDIETFFNQLIRIMTQKGWQTDYDVEVFINKAMTLAIVFSGREREFFIDLLRCFQVYPERMYQRYIKQLLSKLSFKENNVIIAPLLAKKDKNNQWKSSVFMAHFFRSPDITQTQCLFQKHVCILDDTKNLNDYRLIIVDDFIGTGITAHNCITEFEKQGIPKEKMIILTIAIMEEGLKKLKKENICVEYLFLHKKGIESQFSKKTRRQYYSVNNEICKRRGIKHPSGFGNSQSLVSMQRTPNNTFPVFWDMKMGTPLFPR